MYIHTYIHTYIHAFIHSFVHSFIAAYTHVHSRNHLRIGLQGSRQAQRFASLAQDGRSWSGSLQLLRRIRRAFTFRVHGLEFRRLEFRTCLDALVFNIGNVRRSASGIRVRRQDFKVSCLGRESLGHRVRIGLISAGAGVRVSKGFRASRFGITMQHFIRSCIGVVPFGVRRCRHQACLGFTV